MFVAVHSPGIDVARRDDMRRLAESFTPAYELSSADTAVLDVCGLERLYGSPRRILDAIARCARELDLRVRLAFAANPDAAVCAARHLEGATLIRPGAEMEALGRLSVDVLPLAPELLQTLDGWGIRTLAQLAALPEDGLAERFGPESSRWLSLARGSTARPIAVHQPPAVYQESMDLEHPIELLEPLLFVLSRMIHDVCARLAQASIAASELDIELRLSSGAAHQRVFHLPVATTDAAALLKIVQLDLEAHPPAAPIHAVMIHAKPARRRSVQNGLFLPPAPEPEKLEITLARIRKLVGEGNVGCPALLNTHRPDAFRMLSFQGPVAPSVTSSARPVRSLAIRLYRPPLEAQVETAVGHPRLIRARGIRGSVVHSGGPWRGSGDWWNHLAWSRDEWDIALNDGALYRVFHNAAGWYVDGRYD